jgi:hypothetical protein
MAGIADFVVDVRVALLRAVVAHAREIDTSRLSVEKRIISIIFTSQGMNKMESAERLQV